MELNHKKYILKDSTIDLTGEQDIRVITNDEDLGVKFPEVCKKIRKFKPGVIEAYSILEYYTVTKEGTLEDKDGNQIYLATDKHPQILFKEIDDPFEIYPEIEVTHNYVRDAGLLMKLVNTEVTVTGLSKKEAQALQDERAMFEAEAETKRREAEEEATRLQAEADQKAADEAKRIAEEEEATKKQQEEARLAQEAADKSAEEARLAQEAADKARQEEEDAKKAEEESKKAAAKAAKDAIEKKKKDMEENEFFLTAVQYKATQKKFARLGYTESSKDGYHFFYGEADESNDNDDLNHSPFILAEREFGFYEQLPGAIVDENEKTASYDFTEGDQEKSLIYNIAKETFLIADAGE